MKNSKGKPEFDFSKHVLAVAYRKKAKVWGEVYKPEQGYFWTDIGTRKALYEDTLKFLLSGKVYPPEETIAAHNHVDAKGVFYQNPEWRKQLEGSLEGPVWVLKKPN